MLEEILNMELNDVNADVFEEMPQELSANKACGITSGGGQCG